MSLRGRGIFDERKEEIRQMNACACGKTWNGEGACPRCAPRAGLMIQELRQKIEHLKQGFNSLIKIAAECETTAQLAPVGPLSSTAWKIRQLSKEREEALEKLAEKEKALREISTTEPDEKPDGTVLGYLAHDKYEMAKIAREAMDDEGES